MKIITLGLALYLLALSPAHAADKTKAYEADIASKAAQVEALRARASLSPSATTTISLIEAENLLRELKQAPPSKRSILRAQLEVALTRLAMEIDVAGAVKP